jgi:hypothetical protein
MKAFISSIIIIVTVLSGAAVFAEDITIQNLIRAESDTMFRMTMKESHISIGKIAHTREVTSANDAADNSGQPGHVVLRLGGRPVEAGDSDAAGRGWTVSVGAGHQSGSLQLRLFQARCL